MPLSWNEIKPRAIKFSKEWENAEKENADSQPFWVDFFNVFGISQRRVSTFEHSVKKLGNKDGRIDLFWKGRLIIEHKSKGRDLDKAFQQAIDYFPGLKEEELPKYILVSDFENFRLYDLDENSQHDFLLSELHKNIKLFGFIAGYQKIVIREEDPINIKAAEKMGKLHDLLKEIGYEGHELEIYLVRLLFMLFADDTGIFEKDILWDFVENQTSEDGSDLAIKLHQLFQVLNTPKEKRLKNLDEIYSQFPYVNGKLFEENLRLAAFDSKMREIFIESCAMDWSLISPAIFGSLFQSIMDKNERRNLGAHYTSEKNIMKLIKPLFLDELWDEFHKINGSSKKLAEFHKQIGELKFFDPACGSGNFLIIAYRELRLLEFEILKTIHKGERVTSIENIIWISIDQFYGIEIDEWASRIAEVAMWLIDHQLNMQISEKFGSYFVRIPLKKTANIIYTNSLQTDWESLVPKNELSYILGNPPFIGKKEQNKQQKEDLKQITTGIKGAGVLDYVTGWYFKASQYIQDTKIKVAFVSTNSISQGEQVGILWNEMFNKFKIKIHFAHRTFRWDNEAKSNAAVHVVIIGFANFDIKNKILFDYEDIKSNAHVIKVKNINPYLIEGNDIVVLKRSKPISNISNINYGSIGIDSGFLILSDEEKNEILKTEPNIQKYILPYVGGNEFIKNIKRWCLWLVNADPNIIKKSPFISDRLKKVRKFRNESGRIATNKLAEYPALFGENRQPKSKFIFIPKVSSEKRKYIPLGFLNENNIANGSSLVVPNASLFDFGILTSEMHMTWVRYTCGRMKSDYQYSNSIVYNNFPFPKMINDKQKERIEKATQKVLDIRAEFSDSSLSVLYDPIAMPPNLVKAHNQLDKAVDLCYRPQAFTNERARIEFLFNLYSQYMTPLLAEMDKKQKKKRKPRKLKNI